MKHRSIFLSLISFGWIGMATVSIAAADEPSGADPLKQFAPLVEQATAYTELTSGLRWERVYDDSFDPRAEPKFTASVPEVSVVENNVVRQVPTTHFERFEGRDMLVFDTQNLPPDNMEAVLAIGPKVKGDFAVEFEGELINDNPSDLSIFADIHEGPGFQFGGRANTENILSTVSPDAEVLRAAHQHTGVQNPIGNSPLIEKNRFYKVRLEVMEHEVRGYVDGKLIGKKPLDPKGWDGKQEVQPEIYTWDSIMRIRAAHVDALRMGPRKVDLKEAWSKAFGAMKEEDFRKKVDALVSLMGDDDQAVRDGAQAMIIKMGPLAIPSLKSAVTNGTAEESQRATAVLDSMRAPTTQPTQEGQ